MVCLKLAITEALCLEPIRKARSIRKMLKFCSVVLQRATVAKWQVAE